MPVQTRTLAHIDELPASRWNALAGTDFPFVQHAFLSALERTGCVGPGTGWSAEHLVLESGDQLLGALPLYRKVDSWGEFVFDQHWARAYAQAGLDYYPRLVCAIPFTPVSGPRLLYPPQDLSTGTALLQAAREQAESRGLSSVHVLFPNDRGLETLKSEGWLIRKDCQFHWHNRGYRDFEDYLSVFSARRRKTTRRERRKVAEQGIRFERIAGTGLDDADWDFLYSCYARTFLRRGHHPYMNIEFFRQVGQALGDSLLAIRAHRDDKPVAAAIFFKDADTLYGRYWGATEGVDSLHFETCYYQGIEYCIEQGLKRFDPGTQGEHKITRGFDPVFTWSGHWIVHPGFRRAIADYLQRERPQVDGYQEAARELLPFRNDLKRQP